VSCVVRHNDFFQIFSSRILNNLTVGSYHLVLVDGLAIDSKGTSSPDCGKVAQVIVFLDN
jgi:hypothetical protein